MIIIELNFTFHIFRKINIFNCYSTENENSATFSPSEYEALNVPVQEKTGSGTDDHAKNNGIYHLRGLSLKNKQTNIIFNYIF